MDEVIADLVVRRELHDASKLESPEVEIFDEFTPKLQEIEYGSPEYEACRQAMGEALEHHYANNSHHPEHYENGIRGMTLMDLIEMIVDWKAASERHRKPAPAAPGRPDAPRYDNNFARSIEINKERFGYSDELAEILTNTARELGFFNPPETPVEKKKMIRSTIRLIKDVVSDTIEEDVREVREDGTILQSLPRKKVESFAVPKVAKEFDDTTVAEATESDESDNV